MMEEKRRDEKRREEKRSEATTRKKQGEFDRNFTEFWELQKSQNSPSLASLLGNLKSLSPSGRQEAEKKKPEGLESHQRSPQEI